MKNLLFTLFLSFLLNFNSAYAESKIYFPFENTNINKFGFIDDIGKEILAPIYDHAENFKYGVSVIRKKNLYGFVNTNGDIADPQFYDIKNYSNDNLIIVQVKNGKYGYVDKTTLKFKIDPIFDECFPFDEDFAKVMINKKYGFINRSGKIVIKPKYDYAERFSDGIAWASMANQDSTYINKEGKTVIKVKTDYILNFSENLSPALTNGKYGYVNKNTKKIIPNKFQFAGKFVDGIAKVKFENKWGYIDKTGNWVIKPIFESLKDFKENIAPARLDKKWGYIDKSGNWVVKNILEYADGFSNGLGLVKLNGKYGYIDNTGNFVISPVFEKAESFVFNIAKVNGNSYVDNKGNFIFDFDSYIKNDKNQLDKKDAFYNNLEKGQNVCVNHWDNNQGFCGEIIEVKNKSYVISINKINCTTCIGGCSDNPINIVNTKLQKTSKLIDQGVYIVTIPKECITSVE